MLDALTPLPPDPILGLIDAVRADRRPTVVDLGAGVYRDATGRTPVPAAVAAAERAVVAAQVTKSYVAPPGHAAFLRGVVGLLLGDDHPAVRDGRVGAVQTPGGCGALRLAAALTHRADPAARAWVSDPTWPIHRPLLGDAGLALERYPYHDRRRHVVDVDAMLEALGRAERNDLVVLHGCCHNPTGADLPPEAWSAVADLAAARGLVPLVDVAYHGLGDGLEPDALGARLLAERLPTVLVSYSCSKNFGMYRDRVGAVAVVSDRPDVASTAVSHLNVIARGMYSVPPAHGAAVVARVLADAELARRWRDELTDMRTRLRSLRELLVDRMAARGVDLAHVAAERGLFSMLDVTPEQVARLRTDHGVYLVGSGRINVAGVDGSTVDHLADALVAVGVGG